MAYTIATDCFDAMGVAQDCDETAASADVTSLVDGSVETARYDWSILREANWQLDDLDATPQLAGTATTDLRSTFTALRRAVDRDYILELDGTYDITGSPDDITAATGVVTWQVTATRTRGVGVSEAETTFDATIDATLNGDGSATIVLSGDYLYTLDQVTGDLDAE